MQANTVCQVSIMINWQAVVMAAVTTGCPPCTALQSVDHEYYCSNPDDYLKTKPFTVIAVSRSTHD